MPIDTHLDATPSDITASATAIGNIKSHVDSTEDDLISARKSVCELEGSSAMAASGSISTSVADCESLVSNLGSYKTALDNLASALSSIKTDLQGIRDQATAGGLTLNGETVVEPKSSYPLGANHDSSVEVYENSVEQDRIALYKTLETQTSDIRTVCGRPPRMSPGRSSTPSTSPTSRRMPGGMLCAGSPRRRMS